MPQPQVDAGPIIVTSDGGLDLNDVSFLYPLPSDAPQRLLRMTSSRSRGELLPRRFLAAMPQLVFDVDAGATYDQLRVIGARVDPCFPGSTPPAAPTCIKQVRLVAQPVYQGGADAGFRITTDDATVHLFYALDDASFDDVHRRLWALKASSLGATEGRPLDVHPVMRSEGLNGSYATALNELILTHCGESNLTRVAFMALGAGANVWTFGAFNVVQGQPQDDTIPRLPMLKRQQFQETGNEAFRVGTLIPSPPDDPLAVLLSEQELRLTDDFTLEEALTSALQLENPDRLSPKTADCASCHVASRSRSNAERRRAVNTSSYADFFHAPKRFDVRRLDVGDAPHVVRAFGYFGFQSAFSQRTINESAVVANALSARRP